jgi:hypothetical protein
LRDDDFAHGDSLRIIKVDAGRGSKGRQRASRYDWHGELLDVVSVISLGKPFKIASEIAVTAFVLKKMVLKRGTAEFSRRDLSQAGVTVDEAHKALTRLVEVGIFICVGKGLFALPDVAEAKSMTAVQGAFWADNRARHTSSRSDGKSHGVSLVGTGRKSGRWNLAEVLSDEPGGSIAVELHEGSLKLHEGSKLNEGANGTKPPPSFSTIAEGVEIAELLDAASRSAGASATAGVDVTRLRDAAFAPTSAVLKDLARKRRQAAAPSAAKPLPSPIDDHEQELGQ